MYQIKYTKQSFEEVLQDAYDMLEPQDIMNLLTNVRDCLLVYENDFINSVAIGVYKNRNISFKQWKALSAYVAECNKKENSKNNKQF
jgi:hypothetical protein